MDFKISIDDSILDEAVQAAVRKACSNDRYNPGIAISRIQEQVNEALQGYDFTAAIVRVVEARATEKLIEEQVHEALKRRIKEAIKKEPQMLVSMADKA